MANPVPQPNRGAAVGCAGQRLQESERAPGVENVSLRPQGRVSLKYPGNMDAPQRLEGVSFPQDSQRWTVHCSSPLNIEQMQDLPVSGDGSFKEEHLV